MSILDLGDFLLAPAPAEPIPRGNPWYGVTMTWQGAARLGQETRTWDLLDPDSPVLLRAVRGLHLPSWDRYTSPGVAVAGSRHRGSRALEREVAWVVQVNSQAGTEDWIDVDEQWNASLDPDTAGTWTVTSRQNTTSPTVRTLSMRLVEATDDMPTDPTLRGSQTYALRFAADPFWAGAVQRVEFGAAGTRPFFAEANTTGAVLGISSGNTLAGATIPNPGDEPAWLVTTVTGPVDVVTVGVGADVVTVAADLGPGEQLLIDATPGRRSVRMADGTNRADDVTAATWVPVPAGAAVPLTLAASGTSGGFGIVCELPTYYRRAWGTR